MHLKQQKFQCMLEVFYSYRGNQDYCMSNDQACSCFIKFRNSSAKAIYDSYVDGNSINGTQVRIIGLRSKPQRDQNV